MNAEALGLGLRLNRYIPVQPTAKQYAALCDYASGIPEGFYGGAAFGGKSVWLLMAALQYADLPGYHAVIIRKTFPMLSQEGGLIPLSHEWLGETDATWNERDHQWTWPNGSTLSFRHMQSRRDRFNFQGGAWHFVGFDELTQFEEQDYKYVAFSRRRRTLSHAHIPLRVRSTANPGGIGHEWVYQRFFVEQKPTRFFVPAKLEDNPHADRDEYIASLSELDPVTRRQLLEGDWSARPAGGYFDRTWFDILDAAPQRALRVRYWDLAATGEDEGNSDPDWSVGALVSRDLDGRLCIEDVQRFRARPHQVEKRVRQTAESDGRRTVVMIEQEPGSSGKWLLDHYRRRVLAGFAVRPDRVDQNKVARARPISSQAEARNIAVVRAAWNTAFFEEAEAFPSEGHGKHDDQVDAVCGAAQALLTGTVSPGQYADLNEELRETAGGGRFGGVFG